MNREHTDLRTTIDSAEKELESLATSPFSNAAFATFKDKVAKYIGDLITESVKTAKRHSADTVSSTHVEQASDHLVSNTGRKYFRHLGTIGGILLGAGISNILAMTTSNQFTTLGVSITSALSIAGAFLVALHMAKES